MQKKEKQVYESECYNTKRTEIEDYLNYVTRTATKEQRKKLNIGNIYINAIVCKKCGEYIRSRHVHDFRWCSCKSVAVDGGSWYAKRLGEKDSWFEVIEKFYR